MRSAWKSVRLIDICELINGRAYNKQELLDAGPTPVLRVGNFFTNRNWYYSDLTLDADKYCDDGDLLYAWSASFGPRIWDGGRVIYHYHIWKIIPDQELIDKKFLYYFLDFDKEKIQAEQGAGTTMVHVTKGAMEQRPLLLPPLPEQKRIVAILDEAFAGIAAATANAEKNLANARELFTSYVSLIFSSQEGDWTALPLGEICENLDSRRIPITKSDRAEGDIPYYGASGIVDYVAEHIFDEDILLISEDGANLLARTYPIAFSVSGKCWVNNHAHVVRFTSMATQRIVEFYLNSISLAPYVSGMAQPKLNQKAMNSIIVPLPPQEDHARIVGQIEMIQEESKRLEDNYSQKLAALNELKQAILQKAFSGDLTGIKTRHCEAA